MSAIDETLNELADEFELLGDWEERYRYVIELGKELAPLSDGERSDANKVRGCASQVWLVTEPQSDGTLKFRGDSDAHIVRGLIAVLLRLVPSGLTLPFSPFAGDGVASVNSPSMIALSERARSRSAKTLR